MVLLNFFNQNTFSRFLRYFEKRSKKNKHFFTLPLPYGVWSSIVIVHEKKKSVFFFFYSFFQNISKTVVTILIKKIEQNHGVLVFKKALLCKHRTNYIFRDINWFVKMSVSTYIIKLCVRSSSKISVNMKTKFHR